MASNSKSQINEPIHLVDIDIEQISEDESCKKRDIELLSVLPVVMYDTENENILIESKQVTFENIAYYITDKDGTTLLSGDTALPRNIEQVVTIQHLPNGTYNIILEIEGCRFCGEFNNTF